MIAACPLACVIRLTNDKIAIVDPWWWVQIHHLSWRVKKSRGGWYSYLRIKYRRHTNIIYMHRLIANTPKGEECHHKNRNSLDNREANLENVTVASHRNIRLQSRLTKFTLPFAGSGCENLPMKTNVYPRDTKRNT